MKKAISLLLVIGLIFQLCCITTSASVVWNKDVTYLTDNFNAQATGAQPSGNGWYGATANVTIAEIPSASNKSVKLNDPGGTNGYNYAGYLSKTITGFSASKRLVIEASFNLETQARAQVSPMQVKTTSASRTGGDNMFPLNFNKNTHAVELKSSSGNQAVGTYTNGQFVKIKLILYPKNATENARFQAQVDDGAMSPIYYLSTNDGGKDHTDATGFTDVRFCNFNHDSTASAASTYYFDDVSIYDEASTIVEDEDEGDWEKVYDYIENETFSGYATGAITGSTATPNWGNGANGQATLEIEDFPTGNKSLSITSGANAYNSAYLRKDINFSTAGQRLVFEARVNPYALNANGPSVPFVFYNNSNNATFEPMRFENNGKLMVRSSSSGWTWYELAPFTEGIAANAGFISLRLEIFVKDDSAGAKYNIYVGDSQTPSYSDLVFGDGGNVTSINYLWIKNSVSNGTAGTNVSGAKLYFDDIKIYSEKYVGATTPEDPEDPDEGWDDVTIKQNETFNTYTTGTITGGTGFTGWQVGYNPAQSTLAIANVPSAQNKSLQITSGANQYNSAYFGQDIKLDETVTPGKRIVMEVKINPHTLISGAASNPFYFVTTDNGATGQSIAPVRFWQNGSYVSTKNFGASPEDVSLGSITTGNNTAAGFVNMRFEIYLKTDTSQSHYDVYFNNSDTPTLSNLRFGSGNVTFVDCVRFQNAIHGSSTPSGSILYFDDIKVKIQEPSGTEHPGVGGDSVSFSESYISGTGSVIATANISNYPTNLYLAAYENGRLIDIQVKSIDSSSASKTLTLDQSVFTDPTLSTAEVKAFLWDDNQKSLSIPALLVQKSVADKTLGGLIKYNVYNQAGDNKAFTALFDDGHKNDVQVANILNSYGVKGSFYLCAGNFGSNTVNAADVQAINNAGHEVANHGYTHTRLNLQDKAAYQADLIQNAAALSNIVGHKIEGYAYPYAGVDSSQHSLMTMDDSRAVLNTLGYVYARLGTTNQYTMPGISDRYNWCTSTQINDNDNIFDGIQSYINAPSNQNNLQWYNAFIHSWDITDAYNGNAEPIYITSQAKRDQWLNGVDKRGFDLFDAVIKHASGKSGIWYATALEVAKYKYAVDGLKVTSNRIYNPSDTDVYVVVNDIIRKVPAGKYYDYSAEVYTMSSGTAPNISSLLSSSSSLNWMLIGDSITAPGAGGSYSNWGQIFEQRLKSELGRNKDTFVNVAVSGWANTNFTSKFNNMIGQFKPDVALVYLGMNGNNSVDQCKALYNMLEALNPSIKIIPITTSPTMIVSYENRGADTIPGSTLLDAGGSTARKSWEMAENTRKAAIQKGYGFVDVFKGFLDKRQEVAALYGAAQVNAKYSNRYFRNDQIHIDNDGHLLAAKLILKGLGIYNTQNSALCQYLEDEEWKYNDLRVRAVNINYTPVASNQFPAQMATFTAATTSGNDVPSLMLLGGSGFAGSENFVGQRTAVQNIAFRLCTDISANPRPAYQTRVINAGFRNAANVNETISLYEASKMKPTLVLYMPEFIPTTAPTAGDLTAYTTAVAALKNKVTADGGAFGVVTPPMSANSVVDGYIDSYVTALKSWATSNGIKVVDFNGVMKSTAQASAYITEDWLKNGNLTAAGDAVLSNSVLRALGLAIEGGDASNYNKAFFMQ